ncbi:MAG: hypothetical protein HQM11_07655 [SAR324 cluster bacterium]|nr:hypothetical protein [SAR324 cluster bacterium]
MNPFDVLVSLVDFINSLTGYKAVSKLAYPYIDITNVGVETLGSVATAYCYPGTISFNSAESRSAPYANVENAVLLMIYNPALAEIDWLSSFDEFNQLLYGFDLDKEFVLELKSFVPFTGRNPIEHRAFLYNLNIYL